MSRLQFTSFMPAASRCSCSETVLPVDARADRDPSRLLAVEVGVQHEVGARLVRVAAEHPEPVRPDRSGVVHLDRAPQTTGVPRAVHAVPVLEDAGDVALASMAALRWARDLDSDDVLVPIRESAVTSKEWLKKYPSGSPR
jgi:hypothetical protein